MTIIITVTIFALTQLTCACEHTGGAYCQQNCCNDHFSLSPKLTALIISTGQMPFLMSDIVNVLKTNHCISELPYTAQMQLRILTQVKCHFVRIYTACYWPYVPAMRAGVVGKSSGSLGLLPLTNSLFTVISFGNSNFADGLPAYHKSTAN